jgi:hypothetical protein
MQKLVLEKFKKYNNNYNVVLKFINYQIKVIGPLGIIEKKLLNKDKKSIYFLFILNNFKIFNNNIIISKTLIKSFFSIIDKLIIGVTFG